MTYTRREAIAEALYKAIGKYNEGLRLAHDLRIAQGGKGPRIKRGTGRSAQTMFLTDAVLKALDEYECEDNGDG